MHGAPRITAEEERALKSALGNGIIRGMEQKRLMEVIRGLEAGRLKHPRFTKEEAAASKERNMENSGTTSYRWNPPTFTPEEAEKARQGREQMLRKAAKGWDRSGEWLRAMGVTRKK